MGRKHDFYLCPNCGAEVRVGSKGCASCQPPKPWEQDEYLDGLDLPDDSLEDSFGGENSAGGGPGYHHQVHRKQRFWWIVAVLLLLSFLLLSLGVF